MTGLGRSPGRGNGNSLQHSCLENSLEQRSLVGYNPQGSKDSDTTEKHVCMHICICIHHKYLYLSLISRPLTTIMMLYTVLRFCIRLSQYKTSCCIHVYLQGSVNFFSKGPNSKQLRLYSHVIYVTTSWLHRGSEIRGWWIKLSQRYCVLGPQFSICCPKKNATQYNIYPQFFL